MVKDTENVGVWGTSSELLQPDFPHTTKAQYVSSMFSAFERHMDVTDQLLRGVAERYKAKYEVGPRKKNERLFEKARISYNGSLRRVTDYERRSFVCDTFQQMAHLIEDLPPNLVVKRLKNRFDVANKTAKESGSYRCPRGVLLVVH
jgi:hypothetical protein